LRLIDARVIDTPLARKASDHLPIVVDLDVIS
jgi:endonuclease/exonuclease/phosphatase family metal-dependent hydrolase